MTGGWPLTPKQYHTHSSQTHSRLGLALLFAWDLHCALRLCLHSLSCENYNVAKSYLGFFFVKVDQDASKAECTACGKNYSLGSDKPKLQSVAGFKSHLAKHHKDINAEYQK